jgi:hypothetical protein
MTRKNNVFPKEPENSFVDAIGLFNSISDRLLWHQPPAAAALLELKPGATSSIARYAIETNGLRVLREIQRQLLQPGNARDQPARLSGEMVV